MSKYAPDTLAGRIEEALFYLGQQGPLALAEDGLDALDALVSAMDCARWQITGMDFHGAIVTLKAAAATEAHA